MLVILTNTPTPYRTAFFNELRAALAKVDLDFHVLFCAEVEPGRSWRFDASELRFAHTIMPGVHPSLSGIVFHVNPSVVSLLRRLRPRYLITAGAWNTPTMLLGARSSACPGALRIFWSEGHAQNVRHAGGPIALARRQVLRSFDAFAVPNARSADHIRSQVGPARIIPLPNTVDEDFYARRHPGERAEARARLGLALGQRVIVQVSSFIPRKGVCELAEAYAALRADERRGSLLALVGSGPLEEELRRTAAKLNGSGEIRITGPQQSAGVRDWLMAADAFVLAAHRDANPLAPIEASFAGLPIFMSEAAGNAPEVVVEGRTGRVLLEVSVASLICDLRGVLATSNADLSAMGDGARANAHERFRRAAAAENLVAALGAS